MDVPGFILAITGLLLPYIRKQKLEDLRIFQVYFAGYILLKLACYLSFHSYFREGKRFDIAWTFIIYTDMAFTILEYFIFAMYLKPFISKVVFHISTIFFLTSTSYLIICSILTYSIVDLSRIYTIQSVLLLCLSISYFKSKMKNRQPNQVVLGSEFWVAAGLGIFTLGTLPFSIFSEILRKQQIEVYTNLYIIFYFFYIILFLSILKAQLTKARIHNRFLI